MAFGNSLLRVLMGPLGFIASNGAYLLNKIDGGNRSNWIDSLKNGEDLTGISDNLQSYVNTQTQAGPTGRDLWIAEREDTINQRTVEDMQKAGLNTALMYGSSGNQPSINTSSSGQATGISDILQLLMLPAQIKNLKSATDMNKASQAKTEEEAKRIQADTERTKAETRRTNLDSDFLEITLDARKRGVELQNDNTEASIRATYKQIDLTEENIKKAIAETKESGTRSALNEAQVILARASAYQIKALLPYQQALSQAQTDNQRAQAGLAMVQTAYQNKLIDSGYIDAMIGQLEASAKDSLSGAELKDAESGLASIKLALRNGTFGRSDSGFAPLDWLNVSGSTLLTSFVLLADNFPKIM